MFIERYVCKPHLYSIQQLAHAPEAISFDVSLGVQRQCCHIKVLHILRWNNKITLNEMAALTVMTYCSLLRLSEEMFRTLDLIITRAVP